MTGLPEMFIQKNMEWIAGLHVVPVEEKLARILRHQTSAKTINNINTPPEYAIINMRQTGRLAALSQHIFIGTHPQRPA